MGQPQLASVPGRHDAADDRGGREAGARPRVGRVQLLFELPAISRRHRPAQAAVGAGAPAVDKIRVFYNHPGFIAANVENLRAALAEVPADRRESAHVAFTAHSIPASMAANCRYEAQLQEACRLVCEPLGIPASQYALVYQSRSGRPTDPWLGPDILEHLAGLPSMGVRDVVVLPIGFLSDHVEVLYDLDCEAREKSQELNINMVRAATVGTHPAFVAALADLIEESLRSPQPAMCCGLLSDSLRGEVRIPRTRKMLTRATD